MTLQEVIERLERSTEGSRELDAIMAVRLIGRPTPARYFVLADQPTLPLCLRCAEPVAARIKERRAKEGDENLEVMDPEHGLLWFVPDRVPHYTTSLDAAATLLSDKWMWRLNQDPLAKKYRFTVYICTRPRARLHQECPWYKARGGNAPLAMCLAALKARADLASIGQQQVSQEHKNTLSTPVGEGE